MISPRRRARELVLKALYQSEMVGDALTDTLYQVTTDNYYQPAFELFAKSFVKSLDLDEGRQGGVEDFYFDFSDYLSKKTFNGKTDSRTSVMKILERHFSKICKLDQYAEPIEALIQRTYDKKYKGTPIEQFAQELVVFLAKNKDEISKIIDKAANNWSIERMSVIDRGILKIATCELLYFPAIPINATINEAIELAKKYSTERSYEFVNGILDRLCKDYKPVKNTRNVSKDNLADKSTLAAKTD